MKQNILKTEQNALKIFPVDIEKWITNNKSKNLIIWELNWVLKNGEMYEGCYHQICVMRNIINRHEIKELNKVFEAWEHTKTTGAEFNLIQKYKHIFYKK